MEKIALVIDAMVDVPKEWIKDYKVHVVPTIIHFGTSEDLDARECTAEEIFAYYEKHGTLPTTSPTPPDAFTQVFVPLIHQGYKIIYLATMPSISKTYENGVEAAKSFPEKIAVVNIKTGCIGTGILVYEVQKLLKQELPFKEIVSRIPDITAHSECYFMVDDVHFVLENQNVGFFTQMIASLLNVKPSMHVVDGRIIPEKKFNGKTSHALPKFVDYVFQGKAIDDELLIIGHTGVSDEDIENAKKLVSKFADFKTIKVVTTGGPISSHLGKGAYIFAFKIK